MKNPGRRNIYVSDKDYSVWEEAERVAARRNESLSRFIVEAMRTELKLNQPRDPLRLVGHEFV